MFSQHTLKKAINKILGEQNMRGQEILISQRSAATFVYKAQKPVVFGIYAQCI